MYSTYSFLRCPLNNATACAPFGQLASGTYDAFALLSNQTAAVIAFAPVLEDLTNCGPGLVAYDAVGGYACGHLQTITQLFLGVRAREREAHLSVAARG